MTPFRYGHYTLSTTARREQTLGYVLKTTIIALAIFCIGRQYRHFVFGDAPTREERGQSGPQEMVYKR